MSWNDGYERKKFNARIKKEIIEYKAAGMTEEQIAAIVRLDEDQYRSERRYHMHTQEFCESDFDDDDGGDNGKSPLYKKYMEQLTVTIDSEKDTSFDTAGVMRLIIERCQSNSQGRKAMILN